MSLRQDQSDFCHYIALLILHAYNNHMELTFGDAYRDERVHGVYGEKKSYSSAKSNHKRRLAVDFNLFKDGKYLSATSDHKLLGEYWESLDERCRWGGRYNDGNHYEFNV